MKDGGEQLNGGGGRKGAGAKQGQRQQLMEPGALLG